MIDTGDVVLVSFGGESWGLPGGRPEGNEDCRETLDREVFEEACVRVDDAKPLDFSRGECTRGPEEGLVLVRSLWRATVSVEPWAHHHEMTARLFVPPDTVYARIRVHQGARPIYRRWFHEALTPLRRPIGTSSPLRERIEARVFLETWSRRY